MTDEIPDGPGIATLVVPMLGSVRAPTDSAAATLSWLSAHGAPRTAEVLDRLQRHAWTIELPDPDAATQSELWATARFPISKGRAPRRARTRARQRRDALGARRPAREGNAAEPSRGAAAMTSRTA